MKKTCTILLVCLTFLSYAQTLEFSRVIDTVLVLDITSSTDISSEVYGQQVISPSAGKVWKIQSLLLDPGYSAYIDHCQSNLSGGISSSTISCFVELGDGNNSSFICNSWPALYTTGPSASSAGEIRSVNTVQCFENIIWINSSSSVKVGVVSVSTENYSHCISDLTIKAHISILEFKTQ